MLVSSFHPNRVKIRDKLGVQCLMTVANKSRQRRHVSLFISPKSGENQRQVGHPMSNDWQCRQWIRKIRIAAYIAMVKVCRGQSVLGVKVCLGSKCAWGQSVLGVKVCKGSNSSGVKVCLGSKCARVKVYLESKWVRAIVWPTSLPATDIKDV